MKKLAKFLVALFIVGLSVFYADYAYADFALPGCEDAYNRIYQASQLANLQTLVTTDCAIMYNQGWRLPVGTNTGGTSNPTVCAPAWNGLVNAGKIEDAKFIVTHNCPVLYRKGWVSCP
jgi:hypothetical protein